VTVLNAQEWGSPDAPALVCLHGVMGWSGRFRRLAEKRLASRFRVVALDLRGHGYSDWEPPWDLDTHLTDVRETIARRGIASAGWIGHSFGGRLVLELAASSPGLVDRGVLLDPAIWVPPPVALERADLVARDESFTSVEEAADARIAGGGIDLTPRDLLVEELAPHLAEDGDGRLRYRYSPSAVIAAYGELSKAPPLQPLDIPLQLIRGADSEVVPPAAVEFVLDTYGAHVDVVTVPGGHLPLWDAFDETAAAIEGFLG
jgi:lipase